MDFQESETGLFHTVVIYEDGGAVSSALPEVQKELFCLPGGLLQVVCAALLRQDLDLVSQGRFASHRDESNCRRAVWNSGNGGGGVDGTVVGPACGPAGGPVEGKGPSLTD